MIYTWGLVSYMRLSITRFSTALCSLPYLTQLSTSMNDISIFHSKAHSLLCLLATAATQEGYDFTLLIRKNSIRNQFPDNDTFITSLHKALTAKNEASSKQHCLQNCCPPLPSDGVLTYYPAHQGRPVCIQLFFHTFHWGAPPWSWVQRGMPLLRVPDTITTSQRAPTVSTHTMNYICRLIYEFPQVISCGNPFPRENVMVAIKMV